VSVAAFAISLLVTARVLGIAQDGGVPHLGCTRELCEMARKDPSKTERVASLALVSQERLFVIDATPDLRTQIDAAPDGILLTHAHIGHYTGLVYLGKESMAAKEVPVYATQRMASFLENNGPWRRLVNGRHISLNILTPDKPISLTSSLTVEPIRVAHREEESDAVGFIATGPNRRLLYIPDIDDWSKWDRSIEKIVASVDVAVLDGTFYAPGELSNRPMDEVPHPFITRTMDLLAPLVAKGKQVVFIHLNHSNPALRPDSPQRREIEERGFAVATDGMEFDL
jgi:pyrroloquinoline quinone biosynthesis protein B